MESLVPRGTVLDRWDGDALVSLVGFLFRDTRVVRLRIPLYQTFEEVNLRFYVRRITSSGEARRAVVLVRELVPRHGKREGLAKKILCALRHVVILTSSLLSNLRWSRRRSPSECLSRRSDHRGSALE